MTEPRIGLLGLVIFADLDGTVLDLETYEPGPATGALDKCARLGVPVVFVSSKTRREIEEVRKKLGNRAPFASENGGGIYLPACEFPRPEGAEPWGEYWRVVFGLPRSELLKALRAAARTAGAQVTGYSDIDLSELMRWTGLSPEEALLAADRDFDEPFVMANDVPEVTARLIEEIESRGCRWSRGGRFHHISGSHTKGDAVRYLKRVFLELCPKVRFAAIGDAQGDRPMFEEVDFPFLVRRPDGGVASVKQLPGLRITAGRGPQGFLEGVEALLANQGVVSMLDDGGCGTVPTACLERVHKE